MTNGKMRPLKDVVEEMERKMITDALEKTNGNKTKAAKLLGLSRKGLSKKIIRYEIADKEP